MEIIAGGGDVSTTEESFTADVIDAPYFLISLRFFEVAQMFEKSLHYKRLRLRNLEKEIARLYLLPTIEHVDCLSEQCEYTNNGAIISKLVLEREKVRYWDIFKIPDTRVPNGAVVISLELAESLLRRGIHHFKLQELDLA